MNINGYVSLGGRQVSKQDFALQAPFTQSVQAFQGTVGWAKSLRHLLSMADTLATNLGVSTRPGSGKFFC